MGNDDLDTKFAQIVSILGFTISDEEIMDHLLSNDVNVSKTIASLLSRKRKVTVEKTDLLKKFKQPKPMIPQQPMTLTVENVAHHVPCYLEQDILPDNLADLLLKEMLMESKSWGLLPVVIFQKELVSSHTTSLYVNEDANQRNYYYNGTKSESKRMFTPLIQQAADILTIRVNELYSERKRSSLEINGKWVPDIAVANHYSGTHESVGAHSDKLTYIGPKPVIASLTLGATRTFRLKRIGNAVHKAKTYDIILPHNTLLIMFPPCQEEFKHEVPKVGASLNTTLGTFIKHPMSQNSRICLTYRMTRSEYADRVPNCKCSRPAELRPVTKQPQSAGRYFYICGTGKCDYFEWLKK
jgi:alkylated DNA repair dioxygenase AlkB